MVDNEGGFSLKVRGFLKACVGVERWRVFLFFYWIFRYRLSVGCVGGEFGGREVNMEFVYLGGFIMFSLGSWVMS